MILGQLRIGERQTTSAALALSTSNLVWNARMLNWNAWIAAKYSLFSLQQCMIPKWVWATYDTKRGLQPKLVVVKRLLLNCRKLPSHFICYGSVNISIFFHLLSLFTICYLPFTAQSGDFFLQFICFSSTISLTNIVDCFYHQDLMLIQNW